jgi:hypothetical protein
VSGAHLRYCGRGLDRLAGVAVEHIAVKLVAELSSSSPAEAH